MVVNQNDGVSAGGNGRSENLPRVHQHLINQTLGDRFHADQATSGIEQEHHHPLGIPARRRVRQQGCDARRSIQERCCIHRLPGHSPAEF